MRLIFILMILWSMVLCSLVTTVHADEFEEVAKSNTEFAIDLYKQLLRSGPSGSANVFVSPYSISTALAMTLAGAEGETAAQICSTLRLPHDKSVINHGFWSLILEINATGDRDGCELNVANAIWGQAESAFLSSFTEQIAEYYDGLFRELDFKRKPNEARQVINRWVSQRTKERIPDLLPPGAIDSATGLVLTNAIYFKGNWLTQFKEMDTRDEPFSLLDNSYLSVPTMTQTGSYGYFRDDWLQVLELAYEDTDVSMLICLPNDRAGLPKLEEQLSSDLIGRWISSLEERKVKLLLPRFTLHDEFELNQQLISMGILDAFQPGKADFSAMTGELGLFISRVIHKSFIEVNESGTEAAAATAIVMSWGGAKTLEKIPIFRADHPFLFLIRHRPTNSILFMGRLMRPEGEELPDYIPEEQPDLLRIEGGLYK